MKPRITFNWKELLEWYPAGSLPLQEGRAGIAWEPSENPPTPPPVSLHLVLVRVMLTELPLKPNNKQFATKNVCVMIVTWKLFQVSDKEDARPRKGRLLVT